MIRFIEDADECRKISRQILEALPEWFEVKESREQYIRESAEQPFWAFISEDENQGFLCLKETDKATMELAVMGVRKEWHRNGIGRRLFAAAKDYAARRRGKSLPDLCNVSQKCNQHDFNPSQLPWRVLTGKRSGRRSIDNRKSRPRRAFWLQQTDNRFNHSQQSGYAE